MFSLYELMMLVKTRKLEVPLSGVSVTSASFISLSGKHLTFDLIIEPCQRVLYVQMAVAACEAMPNNR